MGLQPPVRSRSFHWRTPVGALPLLALGIVEVALAGPALHCRLTAGGQTHELAAAPVADPYGVKSLPIGDSFRFKAVVVGGEQQVDYVKLYAYRLRGKSAILLHQATFRAPSLGPPSLTGEQTVVEPELERELRYICTLVERAP